MMTAIAGVLGSRKAGFLLDSIVPTGQTFSAYMTSLGLVGAWSPSRKLTSTYTGDIIQLRRSSDSASLYYNAGTGEGVNSAQIITDIGSNSAFFAGLYDQSGGGRHLTQATAANQLQAVNAGVLQTINGKVCLKGTGSGTIKGQHNFAFSNTCTFIIACEVGVAQGISGRYVSCNANGGSDTTTNGFLLYETNTNNTVGTVYNSIPATVTTSGMAIVRVKRNGNTISVVVNGAGGVTTTTNGLTNFSLQNLALLSENGIGNYLNKRMGDVLFFNTAIPDADCVTLERNMGAWHGITVA
ncbi:arabinofuranosidase catalytic domain-containing protein [Runella sp. SP2]|uniref:arabinofuranosidase catalytic domain-containing protein n=1 Tax=Runella sp. SP2 TaxID=2268026 RepID=UPI000F0732D6|nr:arabinofuranosidase catalytic domain-containing protein [Runella sp. SP2]AYQ31983.1 hypothetical protein DTQ70_07260 [Runella sp. SP2]